MDKYTVDLDQVLNDFEYSELTDQIPRKSLVQKDVESAVLHQRVPKHSITNVFHSLSEYLNTDITPKYNQELPTTNGSNLTNFNKNESVLEAQSTTLEFNKETDEDRESSVEEESLETQNENEENVLHEKEQTSDIIKLEKDVDVIIEEPERVPNGTSEKLTVNLPCVSVKDGKSDTELENVIETPPEVDTLETCIEEPNIDLETTITEQVCEEETKEPPEEKIEEPQTAKIETVLPEPKIGFDHDLELDEMDINQAFAELEQELESQVMSQVSENPIVEVDNPREDEVVPKEVEMEVKSEETQQVLECSLRPQDLPVNIEEGGNSTRQISLIGEPGSTPYNNVYIAKEIANSETKTEESDTKAPPYDLYYDSLSFSDTSSTASADTVEADNLVLAAAVRKFENDQKTIQVEETSSGDAVTEEPSGENSEGAAAERVTSFEEDDKQDLLDMIKNRKYSVNELRPPEDDHDEGEASLGKLPPVWLPDSDALSCLHCDAKFTVLKRRHHCRACGLVLCSKCCNLRYRLDYLEQVARVCRKCYDIMSIRDMASSNSSEQSELSPDIGNSPTHRPNPNNPLEYCSTISPLQQAMSSSSQTPPSVMVPVGVLKREGSTKSRTNKSVIFCDGIRPGSDLTNLDTDFNYSGSNKETQKVVKKASGFGNTNVPKLDPNTRSFIPSDEQCLPPLVTVVKTDITYSECPNDATTVERLKTETLTFAMQLNVYIHLKIINMDCCINKTAWCFSTDGMINVGQDEIVILMELIENETTVPRDVFVHLNNIYFDAVKGTSVKENGVSLNNNSLFFDSKNHAGFVYIRPTFECLKNVIIPKEPYLIGILIHRWETPWAKLFPLRLILRLGAEYRYYPCPIISTRHRDSVFVEIGHTIINLLADFRNFTYTLPQIRGLTIHMEDKKTTINIPANRYDQVMKSISNSSDHILAFAGNFSLQADSHLVCIQDTQGTENNYSTHAINIYNKPRTVTGASFIVFNGALKSSSGLTAKSNIVEDGLMIQVLPEHMVQIRESLKNMKNHTIQCGCVNADINETVHIIWGENDVNFNIGVTSPIDDKSMSGVPSIRVHNGKDYICNSKTRFIRWTEVFIIQNAEESSKNQDTVDISKISESIARAACTALVKYLDLLVSNNFHKIAIRSTLHVENVSYSAGSNNTKLPPIYMKSLDNELIPVLHRITSNNFGDNAITLELILRILNM